LKYKAIIEGFEGQNIEVNASFWSGSKLLVNGEPAPKGDKRNEMLLQRNDARQVTATWKPQLLGLDVPQLMVDGKVVSLVEPLKWYQWAWGGLPLLLVFVGGMLGALAGLIAFSINAKVFRTEFNDVLKYVLAGMVSFIAVLTYLVLGTFFSLLLTG
jgi:hypothetical protein